MQNTLRFIFTILACLTLVASAGSRVHAEPTEITVRVLAKGAKFVGTSMGGAQVVIREADTGRILSEGITKGSTGDTRHIMIEASRRNTPLSTPGSASFTTSLDLDSPTLLEISALGPLGQRQAANKALVTQWVIPGRHLTGGDGVLLELPGFVVDILAPPTHIVLRGTPRKVLLKANVVAMCGCPYEPGGLWDSDRIEVRALLVHDGSSMDSIPLVYVGKTSEFQGLLEVTDPGLYEAVVYAYDPANGNTGLDRAHFTVSK